MVVLTAWLDHLLVAYLGIVGPLTRAEGERNGETSDRHMVGPLTRAGGKRGS